MVPDICSVYLKKTIGTQGSLNSYFSLQMGQYKSGAHVHHPFGTHDHILTPFTCHTWLSCVCKNAINEQLQEQSSIPSRVVSSVSYLSNEVECKYSIFSKGIINK